MAIDYIVIEQKELQYFIFEYCCASTLIAFMNLQFFNIRIFQFMWFWVLFFFFSFR